MTGINNLKNNIKLWKISQIFSELNDKLSINTDEAKEIFLFLYDYTNSFKNSNTTPEILSLAGRMLQYWINHDKLIVAKTKKTLSQMKLCKEIIKKVELYKDWTISWAIIDKDTINKYSACMCIWDSFMSNLLITISWTLLCFLIIDKDNWDYEVILGSKYDKNNISIIQEKLWTNSENRITSLPLESILEIILKS